MYHHEISCVQRPLDFPEGESELVSGFNAKYGSGGFALLTHNVKENISLTRQLHLWTSQKVVRRPNLQKFV